MTPTPSARSFAMIGVKALGVLCREHGGRLVEHDDLELARQRLGDLDDLLVRDGEAAHAPAGIDLETERVDEFAFAPRAARPRR